MADKRISELNLHTSPQLSDVIAIVNSGETKKTTYGTLYYGIRDGVVSGSSQITLGDTNGFTSYSSSVDSILTNLVNATSSYLTSETDSQTLSIVGDQLSISNGNTVTVPSTDITSLNNFTSSQLYLNDTFVPYIGAAYDVDLGDNDFIAHGIKTEGATDYPIIKLGDYDGVENDAHIIIDNSSTTISMKAVNGVSITGELTASLQEGYFWVGDGNDTSTLVPTGSFVQTSQTGSLVESAYISLYSTASQQLVASGSAQAVTFTSLWAQNGISLVDGTKLTMEKQGVYQFNFVAQLANPDNAVHEAYFWIKYNGSNFPNSTTKMTLPTRKDSGDASAQLMSMNIVGQNIVDNGYIELWWTGDSNLLSLQETPAFGPVPGTPSIIADIIRVG